MADRDPLQSIGVVIPTLNCVAEMPGHLSSIASWAPRVAEIVVVDSQSDDGTAAYIQEHLEHPRLRIYQRPRGLYAAWNHGIAELESEFTYVSTIGDSITAEGLEHLVTVAREFEADLVVSPPEFRLANEDVATDKWWPIHDMLPWLEIEEPRLLDPRPAFWLALYYGGSITGSSASDIYRTETLKARPFPTDAGREGDTAWGIANAFHVRIAVTPRVVSTFLFHDKPGAGSAFDVGFPHGRIKRLKGVLADGPTVARLSEGDGSDLDAVKELLALMNEYVEIETHKMDAKRVREGTRAEKRLWFLRPHAMRAKTKRNYHRRRLKEILEAIDDVSLRALPYRADRSEAWLGQRMGLPEV